jgi:hypothetical protein
VSRVRIGALCILALAAIGAYTGSASAAKWTLQQLPPASPLSGVSCPSESLCVAVGGLDTLAFSQDPTGGAAKWHVVNPDYPVGPGKTCVEGEAHCPTPGGRLQAISCASPSFCVAASYEGFVYVSSDPTGGADAWTPAVVNDGTGNTHLTAVSCPTSSFCAAVSGGYRVSGKMLTSTDPASGRWEVTQLGSPLDLRGVSCGTPTFCVAVAREGRIFISTNPTGGAAAWRAISTPGGLGDLEGVDCVSTLLCATGNLTGNILTSTNPADGTAWRETNAGASVQITGVSCPTADQCVAVDNNGDVLTSSDPTGGADTWHFENLVPFTPTEGTERQPWNALFGASCASTSLCALVGIKGRIFTSTDPFSASSDSAGHRRRARKRPRTILVLAERFWKVAVTRHRRVRARFRFYSPTRTRGFECKRDRGRYRPCNSPLRYWAARGRHVLRVRAIGPTGLRGPAAIKHFRVYAPRIG